MSPLLSELAANAMLEPLTALAAYVRLDGVDDSQPIHFDRPQHRSAQARRIVFEVPAFAVVSGYRVFSAGGAELWRDTVDPPEEFGARGGLYEIPSLMVAL